MGYLSAIKKEHEARKLRKEGKQASVGVSIRLPVFQLSTGLLNTVEGTVLHNRLTREQYGAVSAKYNDVDTEKRGAMMFPAEPGEYMERAAWWRSFLQGVLDPKETRAAMGHLSRWYRRCIVGSKTGVWRDI